MTGLRCAQKETLGEVFVQDKKFFSNAPGLKFTEWQSKCETFYRSLEMPPWYFTEGLTTASDQRWTESFLYKAIKVWNYADEFILYNL